MVVGVFAVATPAFAQVSAAGAALYGDGPRVVISAGAAAQPEKVSFDNIRSFPYFAETASVEDAYAVADGIAFDVGTTVRLWKGLGARFDVTRVMRDTSSETNGRFPHPFFFNQFRTGTWSSSDLDRTELGVHISAAFAVINTPSTMISVFGGPTLFNFKQSVVESVEVIQSYPYDAIDARLVTGSVDDSAVGFNVGVDVGWFFSNRIGVGGLIRFTDGSKKDVRVGEGSPFTLNLGGFQGGGGIRLRF